MKKSRNGVYEFEWTGLWRGLLENSFQNVTYLCVDRMLRNPASKLLKMCNVITSNELKYFEGIWFLWCSALVLCKWSVWFCFLDCAWWKSAPGSQPVWHQSWFVCTATAFSIVNNILLCILTRLWITGWTWPWFLWYQGGCLYQLVRRGFASSQLVSFKAQCLCLFSFPSVTILLVTMLFIKLLIPQLYSWHEVIYSFLLFNMQIANHQIKGSWRLEKTSPGLFQLSSLSGQCSFRFFAMLRRFRSPERANL